MTFLGWVGFGFVLLLSVAVVIITVACCMRSSQISREEEKRGRGYEPMPPLDRPGETEMLRTALLMVEWQPIYDPDTNELLGQLCLWCNRKPHTSTCPRQLALAYPQKESRDD